MDKLRISTKFGILRRTLCSERCSSKGKFRWSLSGSTVDQLPLYPRNGGFGNLSSLPQKNNPTVVTGSLRTNRAACQALT